MRIIENFEDFFIQRDENKRKIVQDIKEILLDLCDYGIFPVVILHSVSKEIRVVLQKDKEVARLANSGDAHRMHIWNTSWTRFGVNANVFKYKNVKDRVEHLVAYMYDKQNKLTGFRINNDNYYDISGNLEEDLSYIDEVVTPNNTTKPLDIELIVLKFKLNNHKY